ncbi:vacuolar-type H+-ATPase subunit F/Vma7 [Crossiella equi]|uniref:Vacuolar-type H+-ATPase subunit F/Vma7 n=1 Tax=Crossiella equi TaxID=130796 RepID=A0ABS5AQK2_9PSEU|nr:V-type ATP synthase subunit F [Crossiella equi]MBP2478849.1 vacuolar-type H+-ATPase subunit F/Vma7 [Crossiella equi]
MARMVVLGERALVAGWALAGAVVHPAEGAAQVRAAWHALAEDVAVVVLTPAAAAHLGAVSGFGEPLTVVLPA